MGTSNIDWCVWYNGLGGHLHHGQNNYELLGFFGCYERVIVTPGSVGCTKEHLLCLLLASYTYH
jgi:hypothetical protein